MTVRATARRREGYAHDVEIEGGYKLTIDEPESSGGTDAGPSPTRAVAAALAACTAITVEMYAERKQIDLGEVAVDAEMEIGEKSAIESFAVTLRISNPLDAEQQDRLLKVAGRCPVHRALSGSTDVTIEDRIESP